MVANVSSVPPGWNYASSSLCLPELWLHAGRPPCAGSTHCHTVPLTQARGRAVSPAFDTAGTSLAALPCPSPVPGMGPGSQLLALGTAGCCRARHICGALLECEASGADAEAR